MEDKIFNFLSKLNSGTDTSGVGPDTDLFEGGILDSFSFVDLVTYLEEGMGRTISDAEMNDPRFTSVAGMAAVLEGRGMVGSGATAEEVR